MSVTTVSPLLSVNHKGNHESVRGYRGRRRLFLRIFGPLGPTVGARASLQLAGTLLFNKINSAKGFSLLTGGERRCVKWFEKTFLLSS